MPDLPGTIYDHLLKISYGSSSHEHKFALIYVKCSKKQ